MPTLKAAYPAERLVDQLLTQCMVLDLAEAVTSKGLDKVVRELLAVLAAVAKQLKVDCWYGHCHIHKPSLRGEKMR